MTREKTETHENQGSVDLFIMLLHVFGVIFHRLLFVHGVETNLGVTFLDRLKVHPEGLLDAVSGQLIDPRNHASLERTIEG